MSHHGLQVLYDVVNRLPDWACERVFCPWPDMERLLREHELPLYSLETFTPLDQFDVLGFSLQFDLCYSNILTILDLGRVPLVAAQRGPEHPLVIAGGPCAQNPEPLARFIDLFVIGDGEEMLPRVCEEWLRLKLWGGDRGQRLIEMAANLPHVYVPRCYAPEYADDGRALAPRPKYQRVPEFIRPAVVEDLDGLPLPAAPVVPHVETVQDRISLEIMRGCPWRCRFCQSTTIKRPLRYRRVETIVQAALEAYRNTGLNDISLLSLSTSDYPHFGALMRRLQEVFRPLGVNISVPSLRVNEQLVLLTEVLNTDRRSGMTLAPEAARDDMRRQIGKPIRNEDLYAACRKAFEKGFDRVKLYFLCGLPGERPEDLDGILEMAETISRMRKDVCGRYATVVANVSNLVPKPHTPYQWNGMATREYLEEAHAYLRRKRRLRSVELKCHSIEGSLLEGVLSRGDRRVGEAIELAWRRGARFDAWSDHLRPELWWQALEETGIDVAQIVHQPYAFDARFPWDHITIRQGRYYLQREQDRSRIQLAEMAKG
jgi:radical SAM family uncharacterized protein